MVDKEIEVPKVYTYDELLTDYFQTFGYFANMMRKNYEEVEKYFIERAKNDGGIEIRGVYVRWRTNKSLTDEIKIRK